MTFTARYLRIMDANTNYAYDIGIDTKRGALAKREGATPVGPIYFQGEPLA
jgi:hypothetical protein